MTSSAHFDDEVPSLGAVDASDLLAIRPSRAPDYRAESETMAVLVEALASRPDELALALANAAMQLTGADSAGLSLEQEHEGKPIFRWIATAGEYSKYLNGTMPRRFSPCGCVLAKNGPMLLRDPVKVFSYIEALHTPAREVLLVPFYESGTAVGTVWIVHHDDQAFDAEDLRLVGVLTKFAGAAMQTVGLARSYQEADEQKDKFLAVLAHELRNPLSPIKLSARLLKTLAGDDLQQRKCVDVIDKQVGQLAALVNDITDMVAIRAGKLALHHRSTTAQEIISRSLESSCVLIQAKDQQLEVVAPPDALVLHADPLRMAQVLVNLLNNASKYTPRGGSIRLTAAQEGGSVVLEVTDSGIGIAEDMLPRIFDMFVQAPLGDRPSYSGLGIGLALVKQIVELHGGTVRVASEGDNAGSTFTVAIPRSSFYTGM